MDELTSLRKNDFGIPSIFHVEGLPTNHMTDLKVKVKVVWIFLRFDWLLSGWMVFVYVLIGWASPLVGSVYCLWEGCFGCY